MDVYRPANAAGKTLPALVFFNIASGAERSNRFYKAWAEIAASKDLVAILPDLRDESFEKDLDALRSPIWRRTRQVSASTASASPSMPARAMSTEPSRSSRIRNRRRSKPR